MKKQSQFLVMLAITLCYQRAFAQGEQKWINEFNHKSQASSNLDMIDKVQLNQTLLWLLQNGAFKENDQGDVVLSRDIFEELKKNGRLDDADSKAAIWCRQSSEN